VGGFVKVGGVWRPMKPKVKIEGSYRTVDRAFVKVAGTWRQWFTLSDPTTLTFWANNASQTYRESGAPSGGSNRDVLSYWGDGWNNELEYGWISLNDPAGLQAALAARPYILSGRLYHWVGHTYSGTQPVWWGWSNVNAEPASWPGRIDGVSDTDPNWAIPGSLPKPGGAGLEVDFPIPDAVLRTLEARIPLGEIQAMTLTSDSSTGNPQWGWSSGSGASTSNSGGSSGGIQDIANTTDPRSLRIELTLDVAPPSTAGFQ